MSNQLDFVDYDFDNLVLELTNRVKERGAWKDTYRSSTGSMLIELFAAVANLVLYYVERRAEESYIMTAKNKSSIINLVRLLNYIPKRKVSATGTLRFTLTGGAHTQIVFVPKYTECQTAGGVKYLVDDDVAIMVGQTYVDAEAIQGELITLSYTSTGNIDQEYLIDDDSVEDTHLEVNVNGVAWTKVTSFIDSTTTSLHYILRPELDDNVTILFGNGVFGKSPANGDTIELKYVKSDGLSGNVYELSRVTTLNDAIYDYLGVSKACTVTNTTTFLGGDDAESLEEIRAEAPAVFATGDRAVTRSDFVSILNNYAGVADSNAWGENEETSPDYTHYNQVKLAIILQNWILPSSTFKTTLSEYLYTKSLMTVRYSYEDPEIINIVPVIDLKIIKGNTLSSVQADVEEAIADDFILGDTTKLGTDKRIGDLGVIIESVDGVSYSHSEYQIRKDLDSTYDSSFDWGASLNVLDILPESVNIYLNDVLIATDNGSGTLVDGGTAHTISNGAINYTTGDLVLDITPTLGISDEIYVQYKQDENGDVVLNHNQIAKLEEVTVTSIGYAS